MSDIGATPRHHAPMIQPDRRSLTGIPLFETLSADQLARVEQQCRWRSYAAGNVIVDRDDTDRDVYFIAEGAVRVVIHGFSGRDVAFNDIEKGGYFGELSAIDGEPRSASCIAISATLVAAMPSVTFRRTVSENPELALEALKHLAQTLRRATERITDLSLVAANNRIQAEILRLARQGGEPAGNEVRIHPVPIHGDIAGRVSTTRETVARVFGDLTRRGVLAKTGGDLIVADLSALEDLVEAGRG